MPVQHRAEDEGDGGPDRTGVGELLSRVGQPSPRQVGEHTEQ
ncbi:hypothetical protein [Streptomyces sp. NPDC058011]